jgi:hypothetical protein
MAVFILLFPILFFNSSNEFFDKVAEEREGGATWHSVPPRSPSSHAKSLPLQCIDPETEEICSEPYIIFKLKSEID